jgi:uncharacterized protein
MLARGVPSPCRTANAIALDHRSPYIPRMSIIEARLPLETPCIDVCEIDANSGLCAGCGRSLDEITNWASMSPEERRTIMAILPARQAQAARVKG